MQSTRGSRSVWLLAALSLAGALVLAAPLDALAKAEKVTLCHVPPGNPENAHEIVVSSSAVPAHLANHPGDQLGPCETAPECATDDQCADADPCTIDVCTADGACDHAGRTSCDDGNSCTTDVCIAEQGGCVGVPVEGLACDDGDVCTSGDVCSADGVCVALEQVAGCCRSDADCADDAGLCTTDLCDVASGVCSHEDLVCPEPAACMVSVCDPEFGCAETPVRCPDDRDICTIEFCDPTVGTTGACVTEPNPVQGIEGPPGGKLCGNGRDDDCDGLVDGADPDCALCSPEGEGPFGSASCSDGIDNDCDGRVDGADFDCSCTPSLEVKDRCFDGVDNDCDGLVDAADPECAPYL